MKPLLKALTLLVLVLSNQLQAKDVTKNMDALGANKDLVKKAKAIDPQNRVRVVQNREVDRRYRLELGLNYGTNLGGDPYIRTSSLGGQVDFHITPRWSLGARYLHHYSDLTSEGRQVFNDAKARKEAGIPSFRAPEADSPENSYLGVVSFYPIYGKLNLFDAAVAQFDVYVLGGAGQINLQGLSNRSTSTLYTAGGGVGIWLAKHISTRFEARWQGYEDLNGTRNINQTVITATLGFLL